MSIIKIPERTIPLPGAAELLGGIAVLLLARAKFPGMQPLGLAYAAVMPASGAAIGLAGLCIGGGNALKYGLAFLIYNVLVFLHKSEDKNIKAAALGISLIAAGGIELLCMGGTNGAVLLLLPEAVLSACIYRLFTQLEKKDEIGQLAAAIICGGILNGIKGIEIPYINAAPAVIAVFFAIMCTSYAYDMPRAAFLCGVLGFIMYAEGTDAVVMAGSFALASVFASLLIQMGRIGIAVGFLCGITVSALYIGRLRYGIADIFLPMGLFVLIPEIVHFKIGELLAGKMEDVPDENIRIATQLETVARAVGDLAEGVTVLTGREQEEAVVKEMTDTVAERVCKGCSMYDSCWNKSVRKTYDNMYRLWHTMEQDGFCDCSNIPRSFFQVCVRSERFLREFNHMYELHKQKVLHSGEALSGRDIIARQYEQISGVIQMLSRDIRTGSAMAAERRELCYSVTVTAAQEAKNGQSVCGDTLMHFERGGKYFVILCDGMGSGESALSESRLTARLFAEFLKAGFKKETALDMINAALALKADQESFSTLDLLEINLETGVAEFLKVGSAQSFLKTKSKIEEVTSKALPVGILENVEAEILSYELRNNDTILMVSDGVGEADSGVMKNDWIKRLMQMENRSDAELVQLILVGAKMRMKFSDDLTAVAVRIKKRRDEINENGE